jgi:DNA ligase-associated metallophosphoesterase
LAEAKVAIGGIEVVLDAAGALWLPQSRTLIVADLHLEKGSSLARRRVFLPPYDTGATLAALSLLIQRRDPAQVVCLGDSFHDNGGAARLGEAERSRIAALQRGRAWYWIAGNHDDHLPGSGEGGIGGEVVAEMALEGLLFRHEPAAGPLRGEVAGHLHPSAKVRGRGRSVRRRAFATDGERLVMPAFGVLAGGLNVLDRAFGSLFRPPYARAYMLGEGRIFPVAFAALSPD